MPSLLGIDSGLTVTKAVIFDEDGTQLAVARRKVAQSMPEVRRVERDLIVLWHATAEAVREAIALSRRRPGDIAAVAATAHGDGLFLLDRDGRPLGPGILSLDSRAGAVVDSWQQEGVASKALALTGQEPHASAPSSLLAWMKQHEPERYAAARHVLGCKDWLRFCLAGTIGTDRTEASTSFTNVATQEYDEAALSLFGLDEIKGALPPVSGSAEIVGHVTPAAAALTGLAAGTPVACGLHDVTASALGIGGHEPGLLSVVVGTYSINEAVSHAPAVDSRWFCRNAVTPGLWHNMSISPASTANYEWFLDTFCRVEQEQAARQNRSIHQLLAAELERALARPSDIVFHPYLYGSPFGSATSAGFLGLHGWHDRGDLLKAVLEGIVFNHRTHVDALRERFPVRQVRITGGGVRNEALVQMFADAFNLPVIVTSADEAGALGAALCAGAAVGMFGDPMAGARATTRVVRSYEPDPTRAAALDRRFTLYSALAETLLPHWRAIERAAEEQRQGGNS